LAALLVAIAVLVPRLHPGIVLCISLALLGTAYTMLTYEDIRPAQDSHNPPSVGELPATGILLFPSSCGTPDGFNCVFAWHPAS